MTHNPNIRNRPFRLVAYDDSWPKLFDKYSKQIQEILGNRLIEIHHFGGTSIPGMLAKPNIDIYVLATSLQAVRGVSAEMRAAGFTPRGDYSHIGEEYFTLDTPKGERLASVHVFDGSNQVFEPYRNLRDFLISHPEDRKRYAALKRELYQKFANNYPAYDEGKKTFIEQLTAKANAWANKNLADA